MKLHSIETGKFKLDGGAMFGVVPRKLWEKLNPPDADNLCTWSMRCLLIEKGDRLILIDTGMGNKQDEKFRSHFKPHGEDDLLRSIRAKGYSPEQITDVFITHFHFDHVGGAVSLGPAGNYEPTFPRATYWTNASHYHWALQPNFREKASFLPENFVPLQDQGRFTFIDTDQGVEWMEGIHIHFMYGHTEAMMIPVITLENGRKLAYMADLLPSSGHVREPYVMSYDIRPLSTLEEKQQFFEQAAGEDYYLFLEHDPLHEVCRITRDEKGRYGLRDTFSLHEIL